MNCLTLTSIAFFHFHSADGYWWKKTFLAAWVAHVFGHVLKYQKSTEQNPALHCKTKTLLVSSDVGWIGWAREGVFCWLSAPTAVEYPSRQIASVSWGMEHEALLWFWSTDQCQAWTTSLALWRQGWSCLVAGSGVRMMLTSFPHLSLNRPQWLTLVKAWGGVSLCVCVLANEGV